MSTIAPTNYHPSWSAFFNDDEIQVLIKQIESQINTFTPSAPYVFRFAEQDLKKINAVWIGRDPYPQPGVATGRCFEVNGVSDWFDARINISLKNILKLLHKSYFEHETCKSIDEVRRDIESGKFPILPPNEAFDKWSEEGVLFLNSAFTCEMGGSEKAGSHEKLWKPFFRKLLQFIAEQNPEVSYFLWGKARNFGKLLQKNGVKETFLYPSKHPCTNGDKGDLEGYQNGYKRNTDFQNNPCFFETKDDINWI